MRNTPWFQQRRSESAPPASQPRAPPSISMKEQDEITDRLSRPTESAMYRQSLYWKLDTFMDRGFHSWSKMDLFSDCKRCMWTPDGTIKGSCKIRPVRVDRGALPPLERCVSRGTASREGRRSQEVTSSAASDRSGTKSVRGSLSTDRSCRGRQGMRSHGDLLQVRRANTFAMTRPVHGRFRRADVTSRQFSGLQPIMT